jgi:hypothetical protein
VAAALATPAAGSAADSDRAGTSYHQHCAEAEVEGGRWARPPMTQPAVSNDAKATSLDVKEGGHKTQI